MTNTTIDFSKVCKVSSIISQICQIQDRCFLEKALLDMWEKAVLKNNKFDEARCWFMKDVRKTFCKEPLIDFLINTLFFKSFDE